MKKKSLIIKNIFIGIITKIVILALGFLVPRIIITVYGSDINGLLGTVTQIFAYMALLEAGIGQATLNILYKPIANNDRETISTIMSSSKAYFKKATGTYIVFFICLSIILPFLINTSMAYKTVFLIIFFEGASEIVSFLYIQCRNELLYAEGKSYIIVSSDTVIKILSYFVKIMFAIWGANIVLIQILCFTLNMLRYLFYKLYFGKYYSWIDFNKAPNMELLRERGSFVLTELSWTIFLSTDMIILSIFCDTKIASVYSVYNLVFTNIGNILGAVFSGTSYLLGVEYCKNVDRYKNLHDMYTLVFMSAITILMSVAYIMIEPFIELYTLGVTDINYNYRGLAVLFALVQMISWSRYVNGNLTGIAGYARLMSKVSIVEAIVNIVASLILVNQLGIIGVVLGTVIALPIKFFTSCFVVDKKILNRKSWKTYYIVGINFVLFWGMTIINKFINISINNYGEFFCQAFKIFVFVGSAIIIVNFITNLKSIKNFIYAFRIR